MTWIGDWRVRDIVGATAAPLAEINFDAALAIAPPLGGSPVSVTYSLFATMAALVVLIAGYVFAALASFIQPVPL